jgi:hypothetical protein
MINEESNYGIYNIKKLIKSILLNQNNNIKKFSGESPLFYNENHGKAIIYLIKAFDALANDSSNNSIKKYIRNGTFIMDEEELNKLKENIIIFYPEYLPEYSTRSISIKTDIIYQYIINNTTLFNNNVVGGKKKSKKEVK